MYIYADNAATTKLSKTAKEAMFPYFDEFYENPSALYSSGQRVKDEINKARETIAEILNAKYSSEITFTSGGTESDNQAIISAAFLGAEKGKKHIISTAFEHHAVLHTLDKLKKSGYDITLIPPQKNGIVSAEKISSAIRDDTALVSVMYANNEIGTIQPISDIGAVCREKSVLFHTDAVQAVGHLPIDVQNQNIDFLSLSAHKFHGPKGVGVLYARRGIKLSHIIEGGGQEKGRRSGTENVPAIIGLAAALKESYSDTENTKAYLLNLRDKIINGLLEIPNTVLNGDRNSRLENNVNVSFEGINGESLLLLLDEKGIAVSTGSACTSSSSEPSYVLLSLGIPRGLARGTLRITLSRYNTPEEADYIIQSVKDSVNDLRSISPVWYDIGKGVKESAL